PERVPHSNLNAVSGVTPSQLQREHPLILFPGALSTNRMKLEETLWDHGFEPRSSFELNSFEAVREIALQGLGIAVMPMRLARPCVAQGTLRPVVVSGIPETGIGLHSVCVSIRRDDDTNLLIQSLLRELKLKFAD
ncbi:MAG: substrate-binding domain-containing protein, partial [Pseudobdellovibrionaceae bacterium]|nr:substrate-binding domain-containing protein [Pseudobdellovibrionaceae bacterium]